MIVGEDIEIGAARPEELDTVIGILSEAFDLPYEPAREVFYADPYLDPEKKRVLRVGGRIVSCLTIVDTTAWLGKGLVRLGGIAGVATLVADRRRGYASRLLIETVRELASRGCALSALFPYSPGFYRKLGWEHAGFAYRGLVAREQLSSYPEQRHVREVYPDDLPQLERLYDRMASGRTLHCLRDAKRWKYLYRYVKKKVVFATQGREIEGYLLYEYRMIGVPDDESGAQTVPLPPTLRVLEMCCATAAAQRGLLGFLAAQSKIGCIEYATTWEGLAESGLLEPAMPNLESEVVAGVEIVPTFMARVVSLAGAVRALCPNWSEFRGTLVLRMDDPIAGATVVLRGDGSDVPDVEESGTGQDTALFPDRIDGDSGAWAQVIVGHRSVEDACALGLLRASTPNALALAAPLFPRRAPFLPAPDHF